MYTGGSKILHHTLSNRYHFAGGAAVAQQIEQVS